MSLSANAQSIFLAAAFVTGAMIPLQVAFNAQLGGVTKNPYTASFIVFAIGLAALGLILAVLRPHWPSMSTFAEAPKTIWLGGLVATAYMVSIVIVTPKLGVGLTTVLILTGQIVMAMALDHFGAFGNPQAELNLWRVFGVVLMISGVVLIKTH